MIGSICGEYFGVGENKKHYMYVIFDKLLLVFCF